MKIIQINGGYYDFELNEITRPHFENPRNYTDTILDEFDGQPFKDLLPDNLGTVLDIGANVGLFTLHILPRATMIICVEPTPKHMEVQKELIHQALINNPDVTVFHSQSALNSFTGKAKFREEPVNFTMNSLSDRSDAYEVDCYTLFDLCKEYDLDKVDLCKVDIEGGEFQALTVETVKPVFDIIDRFLLEVHPRTVESMDHFQKVFETVGYKVQRVDFNSTIYAKK